MSVVRPRPFSEALCGRAFRRLLTVAVLTALLPLAGCSVPRGGNSAVSEVAGCAAVLPLARDAVHGVGTLVLIHSLGRKDADAIYRELGAPPLPRPSPPPPGAPPSPPPVDPVSGAPVPKTCLVVYQGDYATGSVNGADPGAHGHYAMVVARVRKPIVYRVLLIDDLPKSLPGN